MIGLCFPQGQQRPLHSIPFLPEFLKMKFTCLMYPQHASNSLPSPKRTFPGVTSILKRYFKVHHGERTTFLWKPLFPQDVEHLIDVCGIETPHQLQSRFVDVSVITQGFFFCPASGIGISAYKIVWNSLNTLLSLIKATV